MGPAEAGAACVVLGAGPGGACAQAQDAILRGDPCRAKGAACQPVSSAASELLCFRRGESRHLSFQTVLCMEQTDGSANSLILSLWRDLVL